jgi:PAS domain S-box-containing protein
MTVIVDAKQNLLLPSLPRDGLRLVLETTLDAAVVMKADGVVADWNERAVAVFGWSKDEAVGQSMADLIIPERYREAHKMGLQRYLETGKGEVLGRRIEVSARRKNGEEFPVELSISPIRDGETILFLGCLRDITERHALQLAQSEVARVTQRMAMGEMAASIVHEINQPLAAVSANADAGLRWLGNETPNLDEARAAFKRIVHDSHRANDVIGEIRLMFKNEGHAQSSQDVNKLMREVLALASSDIENQRVSVRTELAGDLPQISANAVQLRQVFMNLITNAVDAMSAVANRQRLLRIESAVADPAYVRITVEDSGMGIDPNNIGRIFEPFFTTKSHGMGMGLAICRSIIENHGGRLSAAPGQPCGTIFQVRLPIGSSRQTA